jgi:membrane protease YdiL (CAAX protease family)
MIILALVILDPFIEEFIFRGLVTNELIAAIMPFFIIFNQIL